MKPLKALLCDLHGLAVASTLTLVGNPCHFLGLRASPHPPRQGLELLACFLSNGMGKQPPPLDPRSHERRLAKTHGQFGGGATLFGHGRFARRGRCSDWDDVARSRLPPDPGLGTADALAPWHLCHGNWNGPIGGWFVLGRRRTARRQCRNGSCAQQQIWGTTSPTRMFRCTRQGTMMDNAPTNVASTRSGRRMPWNGCLGIRCRTTANHVTWRPSNSILCGRLGRSLLRVTPWHQTSFVQSEHGKPCVKTVALASGDGVAPCNSCQPLKP